MSKKSKKKLQPKPGEIETDEGSANIGAPVVKAFTNPVPEPASTEPAEADLNDDKEGDK